MDKEEQAGTVRRIISQINRDIRVYFSKSRMEKAGNGQLCR